MFTSYISIEATTPPKAAWRGGSAPDISFAILSACFKPPITVLAVLDDADGDETSAVGGGSVVAGEAVCAVVSLDPVVVVFSGRGEVLGVVTGSWVVWAGWISEGWALMRLAEKGVVETPASDASCSPTLPVGAGDDGCTGRWEGEAASSGIEACDVDALGSGAGEGVRGERRGGRVCGVFVEG